VEQKLMDEDAFSDAIETPRRTLTGNRREKIVKLLCPFPIPNINL
jgi:hypothetical protein